MTRKNDKPLRKHTQLWTAYNKAQVEEKQQFLLLLRSLCQTVVEQKQIKGRRRLPLGDMIYAATFKVYSTFSSRRFMTDLRDAHNKGFIEQVPHFNTVSRYLRMKALTPILTDMIEASSLPLKGLETDFAVDSTGLSTDRYARWIDEREGRERSLRTWLKLHLICGRVTNIVTSVIVTPSNVGDSRQFKPLVENTARRFTISEVSADAAYLSGDNMRLVLTKGALPYIAFRSNSTAYGAAKSTFYKRMLYLFKSRKPEFTEHYYKRNNVETTFFMIKSKFGSRLRSTSRTAQFNEALCKVLCHNLCVLIQSRYEFGLDPAFSARGDTESHAAHPEPIANGRISVSPVSETDEGKEESPDQNQQRLFE
jgi:transposase